MSLKGLRDGASTADWGAVDLEWWWCRCLWGLEECVEARTGLEGDLGVVGRSIAGGRRRLI